MEVLKELVQVANRRKLTRIDVFDKTFLQSTDSLYYKLYEGIEQNLFEDDKAALTYIYGDENLENQKNNYRQLKSRFKKKMIKTLLLIDSDEVFVNNIKTKAYFDCLTILHSVDVLVRLKGLSKTVAEIIEDNLALARKFNFYDILKQYYFYLSNYYSISGNKKQFEKNKKLYYKNASFSNLDMEAKLLYYEIVNVFSSDAEISESKLSSVYENLIKLKKKSDELKDAEVQYFYIYSNLIYFDAIGDMHHLDDYCNQLEVLLNNDKYINSIPRRILLLLNRLKVFLHNRDYKNGIKFFVASKEAKFNNKGHYNWFLIKEFEFKLYLNAKALDKTEKVIAEVLNNKSIDTVYSHLKEKWYIFNAYYNFIKQHEQQGDFKFSLVRFLNQIPFYSKDKAGFNFTSKVIEIL
ncbi:MAG: hypothetical protein R2836_10715, partial [Chitinophagales bacterium]